jgi:iron complex transport system substrate-binding protein
MSVNRATCPGAAVGCRAHGLGAPCLILTRDGVRMFEDCGGAGAGEAGWPGATRSRDTSTMRTEPWPTRASSPRIASFLASATEIVDALGLGAQLVGISHECDYPAELMDRPRLSRPRFQAAGLGSAAIDRELRRIMSQYGSVYEVDDDGLEAVRPDLILTQAVCEVCAVPTPGVRQIVARRGLDARVLSLDAHSLDEILDCILQVGDAAGAGHRAEALVASLRGRLEAVRRAVEGRPRPRVLALEWLDPPFVPGHWVPEQIEAAGGECLAGRAGEASGRATWEALAELDADALVVMPCGYDLDATRADAAAYADELRAVAPRAVAEGRAWIVNGSAYFNRSGPRVVRGAEVLAGLLHPGQVPAPRDDETERWG